MRLGADRTGNAYREVRKKGGARVREDSAVKANKEEKQQRIPDFFYDFFFLP